jgi:SAM-dependent methyltransferase
MSDVWSERAQLYRQSAAHREGPDLDLLVDWVGRAGAKTALDVATGGGHVARRLREVGVNVVTTDSAPGMQPDVITRAEHLPFADASFDAVVSRVAHHHFDDPQAAMNEMARVSGGLVAVVDNLFMSDEAEEADKLRDPSHVRNYTEAEWRALFEAAGLEVEAVAHFDKPIEFQPWLDRVGCTGADADRVRELLADRIEDGWVRLERIALKGTTR